MPIPRRPRGASIGGFRPCKTDWSRNCVWLGLRPWRRPTRSGTLSAALQPALPGRGGSAHRSTSSGADAAGSRYGAVLENATAAQCRFHGPARPPSLPGPRSPQSPNGDGPPASGWIDPSALPQPLAELSMGAATTAPSATQGQASAGQDNPSSPGRAPLARLLQTVEA